MAWLEYHIRMWMSLRTTSPTIRPKRYSKKDRSEADWATFFRSKCIVLYCSSVLERWDQVFSQIGTDNNWNSFQEIFLHYLQVLTKGFNMMFINSAQEAVSKRSLHQPNANSIYLSMVDESKLTRISKNLKSKRYAGDDEVPITVSS